MFQVMEHTDDLLSSVWEIVNPSPDDPTGAGIRSGMSKHIGHLRFRISELRTQTIKLDLRPALMGIAWKVFEK